MNNQQAKYIFEAALILKEAIDSLSEALASDYFRESLRASHNSVSPKLSAAVCRKCTGDQFRCEGCEMGSNFNPTRSTSGE